MKFLIDGSGARLEARIQQWPEGVAGQLLTPLTGYRLAHQVFAIDNGAFTFFDEARFRRLLKRVIAHKADALFVAVPDKVGCHKTTLQLYEQHSYLCDGWRKAFVAQDGFDGIIPSCASALFIGGTNAFKDSQDALEAVRLALSLKLHVHVGRVNSPDRYLTFCAEGADTCDGSGVSRYDHMFIAIRTSMNA